MKIVFAVLMIILTFVRSCDAAPGKKFHGSAFFKREFLNDKRTECKDALPYCPVFEARGYCKPDHIYSVYVRKNCQASCEICEVSASPTPAPAVDPDACTEAHNKFRALHGSPPLEWNDNLAKIAQTRAEELLQIGNLTHDTEELRRLNQGENLYSSSSFKYSTCEKAVKSWYSEEKDYNYDHPASSTGVIGHFTQVVWKGSKQLGVGLVAKRNPKTGYVNTYIVARYYPAGNVEGHFMENVGRKVTS